MKKSELITLIKNAFEVVGWTDRGATPPFLWEYDMEYKVNGAIKQKRISIYLSDPTKPDTSEAEFYGTNPIPPTPIISFTQKVITKINNILATNANVKFLSIKQIDNVNKKAILAGYINIDGTVVAKEAYVYENAEGKLQYTVI